ncbi:MAG: heme-binding protein [Rhodospirillales bacterium]|nr:heme-binding protein [Rhodospirillales bacterium]
MLTRVFFLSALLTVLWLPAKAEEGALVTFKSLNLETALELAQAALGECRKRGFQVAVAVVDKSGILQVMLRDRFAGPHSTETARRKAWTAISFRTNTQEMAELTQAGKPQSGVRDVIGALMVGGGVPVEAAGAIVGGIGVSGAPGGDLDEACALVGIEAIADKIAF